jgi:hypothetical protein
MSNSATDKRHKENTNSKHPTSSSMLQSISTRTHLLTNLVKHVSSIVQSSVFRVYHFPFHVSRSSYSPYSSLCCTGFHKMLCPVMLNAHLNHIYFPKSYMSLGYNIIIMYTLTSWTSDGKTARSIIIYSTRQPPRISVAPTKADSLRTRIGIPSAGQSHEFNLKLIILTFQ